MLSRIAICIALLVSVRIIAQSTDAGLTFDVVSIRRNSSLATGGGGGPRPGGRYRLTNMPVRGLVAVAHGLPRNRVLGGPGWLDTDRYDIDALGKDAPTNEEAAQMLRAMLRDRFQLVTRREQRDLPVFFLVRGRPGGNLGPALRPSRFDCTDPKGRAQAAADPAGPGCGITFDTGFYRGIAQLSVLEPVLTGAAGRPVLNRTGLDGWYEFELKWSELGSDAPRDDAVSIFTAVQEQLGLRLDQGTAPLDVIVIERIERPSEN